MSNPIKLIESDAFPFDFLSQLGKKESWRKEIHRPVYHIHKWWAKRLGSIFRGILLGCDLPESADLKKYFYSPPRISDTVVFDPFMGSGTTIGEAHKLGFTALGRDINPVIVDAVRVAMGPLEKDRLEAAFQSLSQNVGNKLKALYQTMDSEGGPAEALYYFWVMQALCPSCSDPVDLFSSYIIASHAYPKKHPRIQVLCPSCGDIFQSLYTANRVQCESCNTTFSPRSGTTSRAYATCSSCKHRFKIVDALGGERPNFRLYGKLILTPEGEKQYHPASAEDVKAYEKCSQLLSDEIARGDLILPSLQLDHGYNTRQAIRYGFHTWKDFFNDRQLLGLGWLHTAIRGLPHASARDALLTLFSGVLEFNNMFASYKGEGTGAVRHMFAHHILKPERTPIEANIWGTPKSSGSFSGLYRTRMLRALEYRREPTEVNGPGNSSVCSPPFAGKLESWPPGREPSSRGIYLSCGDSTESELRDSSVDLIVTDPPFFDNVHYSELADFFQAWLQIPAASAIESTRSKEEVQDADSEAFAQKLTAVFEECNRVLKKDGLLVFTYHHSREEGWRALMTAVLDAGFIVVNSHPVKSEMSVAMPKSKAKDPIQLDTIVVCRKASASIEPSNIRVLLESARVKLERLTTAGFQLSRNDHRVVLYGQLLTTMRSTEDFENIAAIVEDISDDLRGVKEILSKSKELEVLSARYKDSSTLPQR